MTALGRTAEGLGRPVARLAAAAAAIGLVALVLGLALGQARAAVGALVASWLFFAAMSAGAVAVAAAVRTSPGSVAGGCRPVWVRMLALRGRAGAPLLGVVEG